MGRLLYSLWMRLCVEYSILLLIHPFSKARLNRKSLHPREFSGSSLQDAIHGSNRKRRTTSTHLPHRAPQFLAISSYGTLFPLKEIGFQIALPGSISIPSSKNSIARTPFKAYPSLFLLLH
jgi:hypothetical protein